MQLGGFLYICPLSMDFGKIASLLHYSTKTIYNYRARISREDFEDAVRAIQ